MLVTGSMNKQIHETTAFTLYKLVFGQTARTVVFPSKTNNMVLLEEELKEEGLCSNENPEKVQVSLLKRWRRNGGKVWYVTRRTDKTMTN